MNKRETFGFLLYRDIVYASGVTRWQLYDPEFAVRPVLKKKAFSGTTDSDGSVTLINASDIPSNHRIIPLQITDMTIGGSAGTYFVEYKPFNSGDSVKGYCYTYFNGSQITPVGSAVTGNFYYYELEG